jgi:hypothetical protein
METSRLTSRKRTSRRLTIDLKFSFIPTYKSYLNELRNQNSLDLNSHETQGISLFFQRNVMKIPLNYYQSNVRQSILKLGELAPKSVRIICYEDTNAWILGKFAIRMYESFNRVFRVESSIAKFGLPDAEVGHHIIYFDAREKWSEIETFMITHLDMEWKFELVANQLEIYDMGICMSKFTRDLLIDRGMPAEKLTYINPAHDLVMKPRKLKLGIASKTHPDGRKLEDIFVEKMTSGDLEDAFEIWIMGAGWEKQVSDLRAAGWKVSYENKFDQKKYLGEFFPNLDYFLHWTHDEGSMAFIDAIAADVKTIITPQGYHLDVPDGITHEIEDLDEMIKVLREIKFRREERSARVDSWTWDEYSFRHLVTWSYLSGLKELEIINFCKGESEYFNLLHDKLIVTKIPNKLEIEKLKQIKKFSTKVENWLNCLELVFFPDSSSARKNLNGEIHV